MEALISVVILLIVGIGLIYFFSDEHLDKQEEKMIKRIVNERSENSKWKNIKQIKDLKE